MLPQLMSLPLLAVMVIHFMVGEAAAQAKPGCDSHCGNSPIPYPFGTRKGCSLDEDFLIRCTEDVDRDDLVESLEISIPDHYIRVLAWPAYVCYNQTEKVPYKIEAGLSLDKFPISYTRNKFVAVGCDNLAIINGSRGTNYTTGCLSLCNDLDSVIKGQCSGIGCCESSIARNIRSFIISISSYFNHSRVRLFNPCSYAFVVENRDFHFSSDNLTLSVSGLQDLRFPVVLDWAIGDQKCRDAKKNLTSYACKENSYCEESTNGPGYRCYCHRGFEGNPYLPNGCRDQDECKELRPCNRSASCQNLPGSFLCKCREGYVGDGKVNGTGCFPILQSHRSPSVVIALVIGISFLGLLLGGSWLFLGLQRKKSRKQREKFFRQNGGDILREYLSIHEGHAKTMRIFTAKELIRATNNYDQNRILGKGAQGTVYKGILFNNMEVAIKKSATINKSQIDQFINEMIVLSQINHRNVVKLLGCCFETEVPLLVYEFVANGTLSDHLHDPRHHSSSSIIVPWETRLKIAAETAGAISYLHSATRTLIIHRDIKSSNILLDDDYIAKVADFGISRLVPLDVIQFTTLVQGTLGYLDPEYFRSSQLTAKSDVYSFGVLLAELLTGMKALCFNKFEEQRNLAMLFTTSMNEDQLFVIVDSGLMNEENMEQIKEVAVLAEQCLRVRGEERPTMKEVATRLEGLIRTMQRHSDDQLCFLEESSSTLDDDGSAGNTIVFGNTSNDVAQSFDNST
ncbi:wall-associated receptor kinase 2-like [Malania oleifera]|uniref:wall-associated receptor kinase 2-like n=1 Tax=Malania oleifera TaxID=397392 RepID=UPI0025AE2F6D|nr:wall-associated receptor kinase 2-like [Malania oleifera]